MSNLFEVFGEMMTDLDESPVLESMLTAGTQTFPSYRRMGTMEWGQKYVPHYLPLPTSKLHDWLCPELDGIDDERGAKLAVVAPRGSAKSTWSTLVYPLSRAVQGLEPYIMLTSDTATQAKQYLENIKDELENNPDIARDFPAASGVGPTWRQERIRLRNGVLIEALGTGNKIRGRRKGESRPSLVIVDDPENDEHISSALMREKSWSWFTRALLKVGNMKTNYIVLGTALHRECMVLRLMETPGWRTRKFRSIETWPADMALWDEWEAIYRNVEDDHSPQKAANFYKKNKKRLDAGAEVLWPESESLLDLMKMRAEGGHQAFETEKQGNPINPEVCEWDESYFEDCWFYDWPDGNTVKTIGVDPSKGTDAKRGDYSAIVKLARGMDGIIYIQANMSRRPVDIIISDLIDEYENFLPHGISVEDDQYSHLLSKEINRQAKTRGMKLPIRPVVQRVNKKVRIRRWSKFLGSGQVRFKRNCPDTLKMINQFKDFPVGDHDDGPDAAEMALSLAIDLFNERAASKTRSFGR